MNVKRELAKNLDKSINSYMGYKTFQKLSFKNIFKKWSRNLETEWNTIPLCSERFEKDPLKHPRLEPNAECYIFEDKNEKFNAPSF